MISTNTLRVIIWTVVLCGLFAGPLWADELAEVAFSGVVKKVTPEKNKVSVKDPESKKRFTVTLDENTKLTGYTAIGDIQKGDKVTGAYRVTPAGVYLATALAAAQ